MNRRRKGNKAERGAVSIYNEAGFYAERITSTAGGRAMSDVFGQYDILAVADSRKVRLAQVKSNTGSGVRQFVRESTMRLPEGHAKADFLIRHDGAGGRPVAWRLQRPHVDGEDVTYRTVVDERKEDTPASGEGVAEYLRDGGEGA